MIALNTDLEISPTPPLILNDIWGNVVSKQSNVSVSDIQN